MPLKLEQLEEPTLNLTPMIDIVLLLVIFFMVGTQFTNAERQYEIELPTVATAKPLTGGPDEITLNVREDGAVFWADERVYEETLVDRLSAAYRRYRGQLVVIRGDQRISYQTIMSLLSVCQRAGISNIQLANRLEEP